MTAESDFASGLGADLVAGLHLTLGRIADTLDGMARREAAERDMWQGVHPVPVLPGQIPLSAGAGTLASPNLAGPNLGYWWDLRRLTAWGFTAGTVTVFLNNAAGEQLASTTVAGQFTWSGQILLAPDDYMVFVASGITGSVNIAGQAIEVADRWLPRYLL